VRRLPVLIAARPEENESQLSHAGHDRHRGEDGDSESSTRLGEIHLAIRVGDTVGTVQVRNANDAPAASPELGAKVIVLFYGAGRAEAPAVSAAPAPSADPGERAVPVERRSARGTARVVFVRADAQRDTNVYRSGSPHSGPV
jgi:hypothetical protein